MSYRRTMLPKPEGNLHRSGSNINSRDFSRGSQSILNSTVLGTAGSQPYTPALYSKEKLDEIELKYQSHKYTQACLKAFIGHRTIEKQEQICTDQLSILMEKATAAQLEEFELNNQITAIQSQQLLKTKVDRLKYELNESKNILDSKVQQQVDLLVNLLDSASNKLYLRNVNALTGQDDFDVLEELILNCSQHIKQLIHSAGSVEGLKELKNGIVMLKEKQELVEKYCMKFEDADHVISSTTLKTVSDALAEFTLT